MHLLWFYYKHRTLSGPGKADDQLFLAGSEGWAHFEKLII